MIDQKHLIEEKDFKRACDEAYKQFILFAARLSSVEEFLRQPSVNERMPVVQQFLEEDHSCLVVPLKLQPGYASWLFSMGEGEWQWKVVLDKSQIERWTKEQMSTISNSPTDNNAVSAFLKDVQATRSLLHELGHLKLADELKANLRTSVPSSQRWATAQEERKAWVFAFCFIGLLLGTYTHEVRLRDEPRDDAPKLIV